jgi:exonuclease SbcC
MIKKLSLKNFCQHKDEEFEFANGLIGIIGDNGKGKSNLFKALYFMAIGKTPDSRKQEDYITFGEDDAELRLDLSINDIDCSLMRRLKNSAEHELIIDGERFDRITDAYGTLHQLLGGDTGVLSEVLFQHQGQLDVLLFSSSGDRAKLFQRLIGTENAEKARRRINDRIKSIKGSLPDHSFQLQEAIREKQSVVERIAELKSGLISIERISEEEQEQVRLGEEKEKRKKEVSIILSRLDSEISLIEAKLSALKGVDSVLSSEELTKAQSVIKKYRKEEDDRKKLSNSKFMHKKVQERIREIKKRLPELESESRFLEEKRFHLDHLKNSLLKEDLVLGDAESTTCPICNKLVDLSSCPLCGSGIDFVDLTRDPELKKETRKAERAVEKTINALNEFKSLSKELEKKEEENTNRLEAIEKLQSRLTTKEEKDEAENFRTKYEELQGSDEEDLRQRLNSLEEERESLKEELDSFDEQKVKAYHALLEEIKNRNERRVFLQGQLEESRTRRVELEESIVELKAEVEFERWVNHDYLGPLEHCKDILHKEAAPKVAALDFLDDLNPELEAQLMKLDSGFSAKIDENLDPVIFKPEFQGPQSAFVLSGGERTALSVSFAVALWNLFTSSSFIAMDEPTQFLDSKNVTSLLDFFDSLRAACIEGNRQIFIITHDMGLMPIFDQIIEL